MDVHYIATTNRDLEAVAVDEVAALVGAAASVHHPGAVAFEAGPDAASVLNRRARSLHRVLVRVRAATVDSLGAVYDAVAAADVARYVRPDQSVAVRAQRRGDHAFTSPEVADRTGQALVDAVADAAGTPPAVDLDDPDVVFRAFLRDEQLTVAVDATGERSLHRRWYRTCEHDAPLRPTLAYALVHLADPDPTEAVVDPTCGSGTVPIEATLSRAGVAPTRDRGFAHERLRFLDGEPAPDPPTGIAAPRVTGVDRRRDCLRCARANAAAAGVDPHLVHADARRLPVDADVVVANLPFGVRTSGAGIEALHRDLVASLRAANTRRAVLFTARPDLLPGPTAERIDVRYGHLDASVVVLGGDALRADPPR